jgi:hypothetical protein
MKHILTIVMWVITFNVLESTWTNFWIVMMIFTVGVIRGQLDARNITSYY